MADKVVSLGATWGAGTWGQGSWGNNVNISVSATGAIGTVGFSIGGSVIPVSYTHLTLPTIA